VVVAAALALVSDAARADDACISKEAERSLSSCPAGKTIRASGQRAVPFKAAPPARRRDQGVRPPPPPDKTTASQRRRYLASARSKELLVREVQGLVSLLAATRAASPDRPGILRRIAEGFVELESAELRTETEQLVAAEQARKAKDARAERAARDRAAAAKKTVVAARQEAIKHYQALKDQHPSWCQHSTGNAAGGCIDEVMHHLAFELEQDGKVDAARKVYLELIQKHPQSRYLPQAYLAFGELFFAEAQGDPAKWPLAEQAYREVLRYPAPQNTMLGYAHYKLAYVYWNQGDHARALSELKRTIDYAAQYPTAPNAAGLAGSARRDVIPVYALTGDPKKAHDFFRPLSGEDGGGSEKTFVMMDQLGVAYLDTGHYQHAIALYQELVSRDRGPRVCSYQGRISEATLAMRSGDKAAIKSELERQMAVHQRTVREQHPDAVKLACANLTAGLLTETAMAWHLEVVGSGGVRGTGDRRTLQLAADLYQTVLGAFGKQDFARFTFPRIVREDWPTAVKIRYAKADLHYYLKQWKECGPAFDAVVAEEPDGPLAGEAAWASASCYENDYLAQHEGRRDRVASGNLPGSTTSRAAAPAQSFDPKPLTAAQKAMVASFDRYLCHIRPDPADREAATRTVDIEFARARTYYEAQHWEEAALAFRDVAINHPGSDDAVFAAHLSLDSLNVLARQSKPPKTACLASMTADVRVYEQTFCTSNAKGKADAEQCATLARVGRELDRLEAEMLAKSAPTSADPPATFEKAAVKYLNIWESFGRAACEQKQPGCARMEEILHNAAEAFQAARLLAKAIAVRKVLADPRWRLHETALGRGAVRALGANYQAIAVYDEAAGYYERYARENPAGEGASDSLRDAVVLRLGLGDDTAALRDAELFTRTFGRKQPAQAAHVAFAVAAHQIDGEDWAQAKRRLSAAMPAIDRSGTLDIRIQAHALLARALDRTGSDGPAAQQYDRVRALFRDPAEVRSKLDAIGGDEAERQRRLGKALSALGEAIFFSAEQKRRELDAIVFPAYQGDGSRDDVLRHVNGKVAAWVQRKRPTIEAIEKAYLQVLDIDPVPPAWAIAAGARVGQMWGRFVAEFRAAPIPSQWRQRGMSPHGVSWDELRAAYYEALDRASEPQKLRAKGAYQACLGYSVKYQHFGEHSRSCETWLSKNYASEYHQVDELRGAPTRVSSGLSDRGRPATLIAR
jgi:tetratricopeptide (TPR) repeat protein